MSDIFEKIRNKSYPQNYLIKNPAVGALVVALFCFAVLMIYKPVNNHGFSNLPYTETMAAYCLSAGVAAYIFIRLFKKIDWFSSQKEWSLAKEVILL